MPESPAPNGRLYASWFHILPMVGAAIAVSVGSAWAIVGAHSTNPHPGAVSEREFDRTLTQLDARLARIEDDLRIIRENLHPGP